MEAGKCYVCEGLGLDASFAGYALEDVDYDHYLAPFGSVGGSTGASADQTLLIHAVTGADTPDDPGFESSTRRNCHSIRRADFQTPGDYIQVLRSRLGARDADFVDHVYDNAFRDPEEVQFKLPVDWRAGDAGFMGKSHHVVTEMRRATAWSRFFTSIRPGLLFTDHTSQVRRAKKDSVHKMLHTYLVDGFPTLAPVNARIDSCGHVVIFDGNHRATAFALAFGLDKPLPIMIWNIDADSVCAAKQVLGLNEDDEEERAR